MYVPVHDYDVLVIKIYDLRKFGWDEMFPNFWMGREGGKGSSCRLSVRIFFFVGGWLNLLSLSVVGKS